MSGLFSSKRLRWFAAAIVILNGVFPALWILFTSLKTESELTQKPITYWPHEPTIGNFISAFQDQPLLTFLTNSLIVAGLSTLLSLFISALAAYAIARLRLRFRGLILTAIIGVSMFPLVTLMVPLFEIMRSLGLLNSYWALVLPYTVLNLPICTLMMVSFFQDIPRDIENAAMLDGCTRLSALWRIVLPLAAPGVATAAILAFVNSWDEFLLALSMNSAVAYRTLPVGIQLYQGEFAFPWPIISAALVVAIVPIVVLIVIFQEKVVSGLTSGGLKG
ncbi:carbohydrate ABC transporter permease [Janthinobacterium lividum]|jgi:multiple sugar transport system permease protein|uniref:Carbohydrate ABC transporter membrane protein 2, CUT1 family (TC 3.A.1.1.-) n=4 Tax=Janthinobacterium TaxID=29580 RepID=A0A031GKR4_9BURK|nr:MULTISPECIES: carbohydrate ABC transporter permease [Janthinobacterium]PHV31541.1 carbohydrate ABC transporter permease [Janthinobacterium sp. BJB312]EZP36510.1 ABC-type sugar transport system, permease component [Janthinobacterium lividum]KAB0325643.1 carbohydrate ABC transporter permease [Janthinobacterium lividum]KHA80217.1 sugar ABC transporter permease [Janthinobacterium lividum]KKO63293.1 Trehalose transport system permease protein SugB [Janthinobacterium sp. KBS0711]